MPDYIGAIDQGTTSTRFLILDRAGRLVAAAQKEHRQIYPQPGWVEHDPNEIWQRTQEVAAESLAQRSLRRGGLAAVWITCERETSTVWAGRTGARIANAVVWQDARVGSMVAECGRAGGPDRLRGATGLPLSTYFSGLKIR